MLLPPSAGTVLVQVAHHRLRGARRHEKGKAATTTVQPEDAARAAELKIDGNRAFVAKDFATALDIYTKAIAHDPTNHACVTLPGCAGACLVNLQTRVPRRRANTRWHVGDSLWSNRAACNLELGNAEAALADADECMYVLPCATGAGSARVVHATDSTLGVCVCVRVCGAQ